MSEIELINRSLGIAIKSDGEMMKVTDWLGPDGDCSPHEATALVCGPDKDGLWYSVDLTEFKGASVQ